MKKYCVVLLAMFSLTAVRPAQADRLAVFACEPEWGALVREIGGEAVDLFVATGALQDPHHVQARPSLIAQARRARLLACTGADLEAGWLPLLLRQAANPAVLPGRDGYFMAADYVQLLEVPALLDRSRGDVHAMGNPHLHLDPRNILAVARALTARLAAIDPGRAAGYQDRLARFSSRWQEAMGRWEQAAASLRGAAYISQHRNWIYLESWLGLRELATLEPKPGLPVGAAHLASVLELQRRQPASFVLRTAYQDPRPSQWFSEHSGIAVVVLPYTVGGSEVATDLFGLFDDTIDRMLAAAR